MPDYLLTDAKKKDQPDWKSAGWDAVSADSKLLRDLCGGTKQMRAMGKTYLPMEKRETEEDYKIRLTASCLFDAYLRTVQSLVGVVFKKEITLGDDVSPEIQTQIEDIDLAGNHLDVFAKRLFTDQFEGYAFILVDMDEALPEGSTLADEQALNLRPYWVSYKADQCVNWRLERVNGVEKFTQITFYECTTEPDGEYGEKKVERYRTFRLVDGVVKWELNRVNPDAKKDEEKLILEDEGLSTLTRIPVAVAGELLNPPPLLGLAYLNISHWRNTSDQENILHITRVPQLIRSGAKPDDTGEKVVGVSGLWDLPEGGKLEWLEIKNDGATKAGRDHILDIEQRMGMMGLSTLTQRADTQITATEKKQDYQEKHSELSTMARSLKDAIELALSFHAEYLGAEGGSIELGVQEEALVLTPQHMQVLLAAVESNKLPLEPFLQAVLNLLEEAGVLAEDVSIDEWVAKIDEVTKTQQAVGLPTAAGNNLGGAPQPIRAMFGAGNGTR